jgi:hypothetical protein
MAGDERSDESSTMAVQREQVACIIIRRGGIVVQKEATSFAGLGTLAVNQPTAKHTGRARL